MSDKCEENCVDCKCNTVTISGCPICEKCKNYSIHCKCIKIERSKIRIYDDELSNRSENDGESMQWDEEKMIENDWNGS